MRNRFVVGAELALFLAAGAAIAQTPGEAEEIQGKLVDTGGQEVGEVLVREAGTGLLIQVDVHGLPPGPHGMHIHMVGDCDSLGGFETAGDHIGTSEQAHGLTGQYPHDGDLPNLIVGEDGMATAEFETIRLPLRGAHGSLLDADGSALMIHAHADDHMSADGGGSGARIACAELHETDESADSAE
jgi:Cu-Zn family superoxide dismutase